MPTDSPVIKRTMKYSGMGKKKSTKGGPFLFPRPNPNFATGRYNPPSKNVAQQEMFQQNNPYASNVMGATLNAPPVQPGSMMDIYNRYGQQGATVGPLAAATAPVAAAVGSFGAGTSIDDIARSYYAGVPNTIPPVLQPPVGPNVPTPPLPGTPPLQNTGPLADAARLFSGSVAGNPFINAAGQGRLSTGYLPDMNQINPAFWRYTSPVIQQALSGLYQSGGFRPEDLDFARNIARPLGM